MRQQSVMKEIEIKVNIERMKFERNVSATKRNFHHGRSKSSLTK